MGELLKQVSWSDDVVTASYFRTRDGDEVDLVLESWDGRVAGFVRLPQGRPHHRTAVVVHLGKAKFSRHGTHRSVRII